jgi:hypothetical protein
MINLDDAESLLAKLPGSAFLRAFGLLRLSANELKLLTANYSAPRATVTAKEMAKLVGYRGFGAANLHYGKLGRRVADALGVNLEYPILALVTMAWPHGECEWTLRPQEREALEQLGLVSVPEPQKDADEEQGLREGKLVRTVTNAYERKGRAAALPRALRRNVLHLQLFVRCGLR